MDADQFCARCGISLDLHPWPEDDDDPGCATAELKADILDRFTVGRR